MEESVRNNPSESADVQRDAYTSRLRRSVIKRSRGLVQGAGRMMKNPKEQEGGRLNELVDHCRSVLDIIEDRKDSYEKEFWEIYKRHAWTKPPNKGDTATLWYKMRLFTLSLWDRWSKTLQKPEPSKRAEGLRELNI